jgi:hypothetical protein
MIRQSSPYDLSAFNKNTKILVQKNGAIRNLQAALLQKNNNTSNVFRLL